MTRTHRPHTLRRLIGLAALAAVLLILAAHHGTDPAAPSNPPAGTAAALRQLDTLRVIPARPHRPGYQRGCAAGQACSFGPAWTDNTNAPGGHNGCDTRNDVLATQVADVVHRAGSRCVVVAGVLRDPYTGRTIHFAKARASAVQVDHIVPLALAWDLGANTWPQAQRTAFANDERLVLLAVSGVANDAKGDSGPGAWMPPNRAYRATYAERFIAVLAHYRLAVTAADKTALTHALTERTTTR
jgi:hypothetical protein